MNRKSKFIFNGLMDDASEKVLRGHVEPLEFLVPSWCQVVTVELGGIGTSSHVAAVTESQYEYRAAHLTFYETFFELPFERQNLVCYHELIHITTNVLYDAVRNHLERLETRENAFGIELMQTDVLGRLESVTQDFTEIIKNATVSKTH